MTTTHKIHPAAELFPMMSHEDLWNLAEDIKKNGLLEPVILYHGEVLDGRNRLKACELAEVDPQFAEVNGDVPSPTQYVFSKNLNRRHLTVNQKAMIAAKSLPLLEEEARQRQGGSGRFHGLGPIEPEPVDSGRVGRSALIAAEAVGVGSSTVKRMARVLREDPELAEQVERGEVSVFAASEKVKAVHSPKADVPYSPQNQRQLQLANAQKERMVTALSTVTGLCRGLPELKLDWILSVCDEEERSTWIEKAKDLSGQLRTFSKKLEETTWQPQQS